MDENDPQTSGTPAQSRRIDLLLDVPLELSVELGRTRMSIQELLSLGPGSVIELDKVAGEPLDILVNNRLVARGEAVVVNDKFGIRITDIVSPAERIARLR
jgi:flagellar motor switch protein FliN